MTLEYKQTLFRYTPADNMTDSDNLICQMGTLDYAGAYKKAYELFSAISFVDHSRVKLGGGLTDVLLVAPIEQMNIRQVERRAIPVEDRRSIITEIALVQNEEQEVLLRLFRHANTVNDPFTQVLFYWHTLVYPSTSEQEAVRFVTDNAPALNIDLGSYRQEALDTRHFDSAQRSQDFGTYIQQGVRNSIAHIVRNRTGYESLDMDNLKQTWHVHYVSDVLEKLCRFKLEKESGIRIGSDPVILQVR